MGTPEEHREHREEFKRRANALLRTHGFSGVADDVSYTTVHLDNFAIQRVENKTVAYFYETPEGEELVWWDDGKEAVRCYDGTVEAALPVMRREMVLDDLSNV